MKSYPYPSPSALAKDALRCWAEVDLGALAHNARMIRAALPAGAKHISVVKEDAYGHGLPEVVARHMQCGVDQFAVANVAEGAAVRAVDPDRPILVMSPLVPGEEGHLTRFGLTASVSALEDVPRLAAAAKGAGRAVSVQMKIDTGMGRSGVWHEEAPALFARLRAESGLRIAGVFTHFASADDDPAFTALQRERFVAALGRCAGFDPRSLLVHADNSAGLETMPSGGPYNAARVGLAQYGVSPMPDPAKARLQVKPVMSLHVRVGLVKRLPKGASVGYGQVHRLDRDSTIAVLCAGYGDGIRRSIAGKAGVLLRGRRCPILGRVSMDQTAIDVSEMPGVACGEEAVVFGRQGADEISAAEFSAWAGTIPWETLCAITKRVPRIYAG